MYKVLVLGSKGMLGQMVNIILSKQERFIVKSTTHKKIPESFCFDIENGIDGLRQIMEEQGFFDYIINCIGIISSKIDDKDSKSICRAIQINSLFPHELSLLAMETGSRVIHISTDGVFGKNSGLCKENSSCDVHDLYGKTKSLGEVTAPNFLNIRTSIIGPNPIRKTGLLEWFLSQPKDGEVYGFTDQKWNGVTTLQFAELCKILILDNYFDTVYAESSIHHFCPNEGISKYELLKLFKLFFRSDLTIKPRENINDAVSRNLGTNYQCISDKFGKNNPMKNSIKELAFLIEKTRI